MRVLISGAAGFLGSHLVKRFINDDHDVVGFDNFSGGLKSNLENYEGYMRNQTCWNVDMTSTEFMNSGTDWIFKNIDVVYHCAAQPYEGVSVFSPGHICDNIYSGSVNVFTKAIRCGVKRIIFCSSMARYGKGNGNKAQFVEWQNPAPQDPYGIAKVAAEETLKCLCDVHGVEYIIAVPHNIYGPNQYYFDPYRNVAAIFANAMLQGIRPIIYGDGLQRRSFSYVLDCVEPLVRMATIPYDGSLWNNWSNKIINIGPDGNDMSIMDLYRMMQDITNRHDIAPIYMPDRPQEVKIAHCSSDKARTILNFEAKMDTYGGMQKLVDWIREVGPKPFNYDKLSLEIINSKTPKNWTDRMLMK